MKKTIELVSNSWGLRGGHNLWLPDNVGKKQDCNACDIVGKRKGIINFGALLPGADVPDGTKVTITIDLPRKAGWYPVITKKNEFKMLLWYNGIGFVANQLNPYPDWREPEFSWIADEPIPDPFERIA